MDRTTLMALHTAIIDRAQQVRAARDWKPIKEMSELEMLLEAKENGRILGMLDVQKMVYQMILETGVTCSDADATGQR